MRKIYIFAALVLAAAVSCSKEIAPIEKISVEVAPEGYVPVTLCAQLDPATKATMDGKDIMWEVDEEVAVFANGAGDPIPFKVVEINTGDSKNGVVIYGSVPEGTQSFIAAYPYQEGMKCAEGVVTMSIPDVQTIPDGKTYDPAAFTSVAYFANASTPAQFRNVMSMVKFNVGSTQNVSGAVITYKGESVASAGTIKVTVGDGSQAPEVANACKSSVRVVCDFVPGTDYYAMVAPGKIDGIVAYALAGNKASVRESEKKENQIDVERNKGLNLGDITATEVSLSMEISNATELADFLQKAYAYPAGWEVLVTKDIDCSAAEFAPAESFAGIFNGQDFTLNNLTISNALFANLTKDAVVKNVKVNNGVINWTSEIADMTGISFIASKSKGQILNCDVKGNITVSTDTAGRIYCAGVVGESTTGYVEGCKFEGNIDVTLSGTSQSCSAIAGVAARVGSTSMEGQVIVKDCVNNGNIKFLFSGASGNMKKFGIGGVIGQTPSVANAPSPMGIITDCVNNGNIEWSYPEGGNGSYPALGGVAGIVEGELHRCKNYGSVKYTGEKVKAATDASIGGVAGYVTCDASDCHNYGKVSTDGYFAGGTSMAQSGGNSSWSTFGGVFGNAGPFGTDKAYMGDKEVTVSNCSNEGQLEFKSYMVTSGGPNMCFGGVVGCATADLSNCQNKGAVTVKTQTKIIYAGGVAGFLAADMDNCSNSGEVVVDGCKDDHTASIDFQTYFGGIFGMISKDATVDKVVNSGNITFQNGYTKDGILNYVGGIGGSYVDSYTISDAENTGTITSTSDSPICLGGLFGAVNGSVDGARNSGEVIYSKTYCSETEGKQPEVGGIAGYGYARFGFKNMENTGKLTNAAEGGAVGGLLGSYNYSGNANTTWSDCVVNCTIAGPATAGSLLGKFRNTESQADIDAGKAPATIVFGTSDGPVKVLGDANVLALPMVGDLKGNTAVPGNVIIGDKTINLVEDLENKYIIYAGKKYPIIKLADERWWMAAPLAYVPAGKTVSADPAEDAGIWYAQGYNGDDPVARTDYNDGYLYDASTAFGVEVTAENYMSLEGAQGICPEGWYIPTRADYYKLVGSSNKASGEQTAPEDPNALYYVDGYKGSSLKKFDEIGWGAKFLGVRTKNPSTTSEPVGQYNKVKVDDSTGCTVEAYMGNPRLNYWMTSTGYTVNANTGNIQFFGLMTTFSKSYPECRLTLSYQGYWYGTEVRCIRKAEQ